jgi:hypothetical protein
MAWRRYKRLMAWMVVVAIAAIAAALIYLKRGEGSMPWPMIAATIGGVGLSVLLGTALMGLVFLSNNSGHDDMADGDNFGGNDNDS